MGLSSPPPPYSAVGAGGGRTSGALQPGAQKGWARLKARGFPRRVQLPLWWRRRFVVLAGRRLLLFAEPPPSGALANASSYIHASGNYGGLRIKVIELDDLEWLLPETWFEREAACSLCFSALQARKGGARKRYFLRLNSPSERTLWLQALVQEGVKAPPPALSSVAEVSSPLATQRGSQVGDRWTQSFVSSPLAPTTPVGSTQGGSLPPGAIAGDTLFTPRSEASTPMSTGGGAPATPATPFTPSPALGESRMTRAASVKSVLKQATSGRRHKLTMEVIDDTEEEGPQGSELRELLAAALSEAAVTSNVPPTQLPSLLDELRRREVADGETLFAEGDAHSDFFYVVESGDYVDAASGAPAGAAFGHEALFHSCPRASGVVARGGGVLWQLSAEQWRLLSAAIAQARSGEMDRLLARVDVLKALTDGQRKELVHALEVQLYGPGEVITRQDEVGDRIYIIVTGTVVETRRQNKSKRARWSEIAAFGDDSAAIDSTGESDPLTELRKLGVGPAALRSAARVGASQAADSDQLVAEIATLKSGDVWGERGLVRAAPRSSTHTASMDGAVEIASLGHATFKRILGSLEQAMMASARARMLQSYVMLRGADIDTLAAVARAVTHRDYSDGEVMQAQGDGHNIFLLEEGVAEVSVAAPGGKVVRITSVPTGDICGEDAALGGQPGGALVTLRARGTVRAWVGDASEMLRVLPDRAQAEARYATRMNARMPAWLKSLPLLAGAELTSRALVDIQSACTLRAVEEGATIITQGDKGEIFYLMYQGEAIVNRRRPGLSSLLKVGTLSEGDFFGEQELLDGADGRRSATVVAGEGGAEVLEIPAELFRQHLAHMQAIKYAARERGGSGVHKSLKQRKSQLASMVAKTGRVVDRVRVFTDSDKSEAAGGGKAGPSMPVHRAAAPQPTAPGADDGPRSLLDLTTTPSPQKPSDDAGSSSSPATPKAPPPMQDVTNATEKGTRSTPGRRMSTSHRVTPPRRARPPPPAVRFGDLSGAAGSPTVTLGMGTFGRVRLVRHKHTGQHYALKCLKKQAMVEMDQVEHTLSEVKCLRELRHPFIVSLVTTFNDPARVHMLMELVQGGELYGVCQSLGKFKEPLTTWYAAQVVVMLDVMHSRGYCYRDLKPENLLMCAGGKGGAGDGYLKLWCVC